MPKKIPGCQGVPPVASKDARRGPNGSTVLYRVKGRVTPPRDNRDPTNLYDARRKRGETDARQRGDFGKPMCFRGLAATTRFGTDYATTKSTPAFRAHGRVGLTSTCPRQPQVSVSMAVAYRVLAAETASLQKAPFLFCAVCLQHFLRTPFFRKRCSFKFEEFSIHYDVFVRKSRLKSKQSGKYKANIIHVL